MFEKNVNLKSNFQTRKIFFQRLPIVNLDSLLAGSTSGIRRIVIHHIIAVIWLLIVLTDLMKQSAVSICLETFWIVTNFLQITLTSYKHQIAVLLAFPEY